MCYRALLALAATVLTLVTSAPADAANQYRRWLAPKNFTCTSGAQVQVGIDNQDVGVANPIPTLSGWMLLALATMMVMLGAARARR